MGKHYDYKWNQQQNKSKKKRRKKKKNRTKKKNRPKKNKGPTKKKRQGEKEGLEKEKKECIWIGSKETCTICSDEGMCRIKSKKKGGKRDRRIVGGEKSEEPREFMVAIMLQIDEEKLESMASKSGRQQKKGKIQKNGKIKGKRLQRI